MGGELATCARTTLNTLQRLHDRGLHPPHHRSRASSSRGIHLSMRHLGEVLLLASSSEDRHGPAPRRRRWRARHGRRPRRAPSPPPSPPATAIFCGTARACGAEGNLSGLGGRGADDARQERGGAGRDVHVAGGHQGRRGVHEPAAQLYAYDIVQDHRPGGRAGEQQLAAERADVRRADRAEQEGDGRQVRRGRRSSSGGARTRRRRRRSTKKAVRQRRRQVRAHPRRRDPAVRGLKDTVDRCLPYGKPHDMPALQRGKTVLVAALGNSIRGVLSTSTISRTR